MSQGQTVTYKTEEIDKVLNYIHQHLEHRPYSEISALFNILRSGAVNEPVPDEEVKPEEVKPEE